MLLRPFTAMRRGATLADESATGTLMEVLQ